MRSNEIMWKPHTSSVEEIQLAKFIDFVNKKHSLKLKRNYSELWEWSVSETTSFWDSVWDFVNIIGEKGVKIIENASEFPGAKFFPDTQLNYAQNLLRNPSDELAIEEFGEDGREKTISRKELRDKTLRMAGWLKSKGIKKGDRVCAYMPNCSETIITMLATASLGGIFSSCSSDFGAAGVIDRFEQIEPKILVAANGYNYNGKLINRMEEIDTISKELTTLNEIVILNYLDSKQTSLSYTEFEVVYLSQPLAEFFPVNFNDPLYIVFSSGTTGKPKCIVHSVGGVLIQHAKEHMLHLNLKEKEKIFYFTTCGWMMWNWLVGSLFCQSSIILYEGNPFHTDPSKLWGIAEKVQVNIFGTSAKYVDALSKTKVKPKKIFDLKSIRTLCSTGSPLSPESYDFIKENIKSDLQVASISGGTDLLSCFVLSNPFDPVIRGEIQCRGLGMDVDIFDTDGTSLINKEGELVCKKPFPSMPIKFWNDPQNEKYKAAYFNYFDDTWRHGDWAKITDRGTIRIFGRSDTTLNPGGVRIGTSEIYRQVEQLKEINECLVIGQNWKHDTRIILFAKLQDDFELNKKLKNKIKDNIKKNLSPRHVPAKIISVTDIPRTRSGKITELAVRDIVHNIEIKNQEALANPEALNHFRNLQELMED